MAQTNPVVELYYSGAWHDITATNDVYTRDPIQITRGRQDEMSRISPSRLDLSIKNTSGKYSPRNPSSSLYGLIGRNTPIRVAVDGYDYIADTFNRVAASGWGTCEYDASYWEFGGSGGTVGASDVHIDTPLTAIHSVPATSAYRFSYLLSTLPDDVTVSVRLKALDTAGGHDILGGDIEGGLMLRIQNTNNYYHPRVEFNADQTITASIHTPLGGSLGSATPAANITYAGQWLWVKAQATGSTVRMKVWEDGNTEPVAWDLSVTDSSVTGDGGVGVRSGVASGNTNTGCHVYYQNFTVDHAPRFHGEVESWPQRWSVDGNDVWSPIVANGILRRLNAPGTTPKVWSSLRRAIMTTGLLAYWALADGELSTAGQLTSGTGQAMVLSSTYGSAKFGALDMAPWLERGMALDIGASLTGRIEGMTSTPDEYTVDLVKRGAAGQLKLSLYGDNPAVGVRFDLYMTATPFRDIEMYVYLNDVELDYDGSFSVPNFFDDSSHHVRVRVVQDTVDINWYVDVDGVNLVSGVAASATLNGATTVKLSYGTVTGVDNAPIGVSHVVVWEGTPPALSTMSDAAAGHAGETAAARIERLCSEEGITLTVIGDGDLTESVGVQRLAPVVELLQDPADADGGILYEPRGYLGLAYRTRNSLYNQTATVDLDYSAGGEVAPPLNPVEDTDTAVNDVTVTRYLGTSANAVQETGSLNVQKPSDDPQGIGRIPKDVRLVLAEDEQCEPQAYWRLHLGTWDESRYPVVNLDLTAMEVESKTTLASQAASLDIGGRFTITNPPSWLPPDDIEQHAQGFVETIASHRHTIGVNATPAGPYRIAEVDHDQYSYLGSDGSTVAAAFDAGTDTSLSVTVAAGYPLWSDDDAPFDIVASGVRLTVTAVAGAASPQTFTVNQQPVNGITKTISAGEAVDIFHGSYIGL